MNHNMQVLSQLLCYSSRYQPNENSWRGLELASLVVTFPCTALKHDLQAGTVPLVGAL